MTAEQVRGVRSAGARWLRGAAVAATVLIGAAAALAQDLNSQIDRVIAASKVGDAQVGVSVIDLGSGRVLAARNAATPMIPASNMKLITTGAALLVLGEQFVFRTELILDGERLILRGSGDPALADPALLAKMDPKLTVREMLGTLAGAVRKAGVSHVSEIVVDDRVFDRELVHPSWPKDQLDRWYCAEVSGVNFHTNVLSVFPAPGRGGPGSTPTATLEPEAPWIGMEVRAKTVGQGRTAAWLSRDPDENRFTLHGEVRTAVREPIEVTLHDPALFTGRLLAASLLEAGVGVGPAKPAGKPSGEQIRAATAAVRTISAEEAAPDGRAVAAVTTHIRDVLDRCNGDSQNLYAEALLKRIGNAVTGAPGSWSNGSSVARMTLSEKIGPEYAASTVVADGSGLSRGNRVSPATFTTWLAALQDDSRVGGAFIASIPKPTKGNFRRRFQDHRLKNELRAKSGSIDGVRCLSGYLTDPESGRRVAFSVMVNGLKAGEPTLRALDLHEEIVKVADRWLAEQRPERAKAPEREALGG